MSTTPGGVVPAGGPVTAPVVDTFLRRNQRHFYIKDISSFLHNRIKLGSNAAQRHPQKFYVKKASSNLGLDGYTYPEEAADIKQSKKSKLAEE